MSAESGRGPERDLDLRLARLHLRAGLVALARAELEAAAGLGILDRDGLADLAEARWRTGDLLGAGVAAEAHLGSAGDELVAHVIAAEARFAEGRRAEAEAAVEAAAAAAAPGGGPVLLRALFAGLPASPIWGRVFGPSEGEEAIAAERTPAVGAPGRPIPAGARPPAPGAEEARPEAGPSSAPVGASAGPAAAAAWPAAAAAWLAVARAAVAEGRFSEALTVLGLVLRRESTAAAAVLDVLGPLEGPAADLLRGDALRLLGRGSEAEAAYRAAEEALQREAGA